MADPAAYRASVVRADPYSVEYDNGAVLPRDGFAHEDANIFEGIQRAPAEPMGGSGAGPMLADAGAGAAFNQEQGTSEQGLSGAEQALMDSSARPDVTPTWGGAAAARVAEPGPLPRYAPMQTGQAPYEYPNAVAPDYSNLRPYAAPTNVETPGAAATPEPGAAWVAPTPQGHGASSGGGGGGGPRISTTTQTQGGVPIDEEALRGYNYQSGLAADAERGLARVHGDAAQARMESAADVGARANAAEAQRVVHERERLKAADTAESDYRRAVTEFSAREVDPAKWYHDRGTGGTIAAALAMGLGAFGSSLTGGPNTAVQIISDAINADIDAQKSNIATAGKGLEAQRGLLGEMRVRFGDERQAEAAAKAAIFDQAARDAVAMEAQAEANGAPAQGQRASALLGMAAAEYQQKLRGEAADRVTTSRSVSAGGGGGGGRRGSIGGAGGAAAFEIPGTVISDPTRVSALRPTDRAAVADGVAGLLSFRDGIDRMLEMRRQHGRTIPGSEADVRGNALQRRMVTALSRISNAGTINGAERVDYAQQLPEPGAWGPNIEARLNELRATTERDMQNTLYVNGYGLAQTSEAPTTLRRAGQ